MPETYRRSLRTALGGINWARCEEKKTLMECFWWVLVETMNEMLKQWVDSTAEN